MKTRVLHEIVDYGVATRIIVCVDFPPPRHDASMRIYMDFYPGEGLLKIAGKFSILAGEVAKKALFPPHALDAKSKLARKRVDLLVERMRGK